MIFFILFPSQGHDYFDKKLSKLTETYCDVEYELPSKSEDF